MGLRVAFGDRLTRFAVVGMGLAALVGTYVYLARPERNPERLWQSVQADLRAQRFERAYAAMRRLLDLRRANRRRLFDVSQARDGHRANERGPG